MWRNGGDTWHNGGDTWRRVYRQERRYAENAPRVWNQATHSAARDWALGGSAAHRCGTWHCSAGQPAGTGRDRALKCPHLVRDWHSSAFDHTGT